MPLKFHLKRLMLLFSFYLNRYQFHVDLSWTIIYINTKCM